MSTLIGSRNCLAFELHPLVPTWEMRYLPERSGWAELSIWVDGRNLCQNVLPGSNSIREGVNVPLAPLADWLARSWMFIQFEERPGRFPLRDSARDTLRHWGDISLPSGVDEDEWLDARERWWTRHFLAAGAEGAQLPDISLVRGDDRLFIEWAPASFAGARPPRFIAGEGQAAVPWDDAEAVFAEFVAYMADWLRREGLDDCFSWVRLADPLREMDTGFMEKLRIYTGINGDDLRMWTETSTEVALRERLGIREGTEDPGASVITQVLCDLSPKALGSVGEPLLRLDETSRCMTNFAYGLRAAACTAAAAAGDNAERAGQLAARAVRDDLGLNGQPVEDMDGRMGELGVEILDSEGDGASMLVGSRREKGSAVVIFRTRRTVTRWGRRFELARALGHLVTNPWRGDTLGAASTEFSRPWSRRCSGSFAAEFLLPSSYLYQRFKDLDSASNHNAFPALLDDYGVGARTAAFQLWNHGLLSSRDRRDELIDEYASTSAPVVGGCTCPDSEK